MTYLSVVIPVYNESSLIDELIKRVKTNVQLITEDFEIIIVDDGSKDSTWNSIEIEAKAENKVKGIKLSKNFGHHYAITAGLQHAIGEWVVVMDGDLQDRPEVIPELYEKAQQGFEIVFVSRQNRPEKLYYRITQKVFYFILRLLSGIKLDSSQANFSIINRKVVEAFKLFPENSRFYGSTINWLGFKRTSIFADHGLRHSGKPSYTLKKRIKLGTDIILAFSDRPLKFAIGLGLVISSVSIIVGVVIVIGGIENRFTVTGWASLMVSIFFLSGVLLIVMGILGVYIGKIFNEMKHRPLYIVSEFLNKNN
jgi:glycosyltransferase involved in cell wall biosynthesis